MADRPPSPLVLDTHVWIWLMEGDRRRLSDAAIEAVSAAAREGAVRISAISVWELAMLDATGRISLSRPIDDWVNEALGTPGVLLLPLSPEIAVESTRLPGSPHGDPADRILMASARILGGRLATCDTGILDYGVAGHLAVLDGRHRRLTR
ncbi:MAG TPA: type II toxin-antitoxin system VapC family toxin [Longimicrobium sp.]|nr:type II toxin-antitoxin system VapC family toxin [Longimicrobium sp.]